MKPCPEKMIFQASTWEMNPSYSKEILREQNKYMSDDEFDREYGAMFQQQDTNNITTSIRLPSNQIEELKKIAREQSYKQDCDISYIDIIRDIISRHVSA